MTCPQCHQDAATARVTRSSKKEDSVCRIRECPNCGWKFTTREITEVKLERLGEEKRLIDQVKDGLRALLGIAPEGE